jgi:hypothetical protein
LRIAGCRRFPREKSPAFSVPPGGLLRLWNFLHIYAKNSRLSGPRGPRSGGGLQGIKLHFREFLYDFALKRGKLLDISFAKALAVFRPPTANQKFGKTAVFKEPRLTGDYPHC